MVFTHWLVETLTNSKVEKEMANVELNKGKCNKCGFKGTVATNRDSGQTACAVCDRASWEAAGRAR